MTRYNICDILNNLPYHSEKCFCRDCSLREYLELQIVEDLNEGLE